MRIPDTETGEFIPGNPAIGKPGSMLTAAYMNSDLREKKNILTAAGMTPNPDDDGQLLKAVRYLLEQAVANRPLIVSISNLPAQNRGPIIVAECAEVWVWTTSAYFSGYRSPLCGRPVDGHTTVPLASELDATGGLVPKVGTYAGLWGYAQENGLVVSQAAWTANIGAHYFVDVNASTFRVPDLRNMFRRYTGTDADTANARAIGSAQRDASQAWSGSLGFVPGASSSGVVSADPGDSRWAVTSSPGSGHQMAYSSITASRQIRTSSETRPANVAYHPRIHV